MPPTKQKITCLNSMNTKKDHNIWCWKWFWLETGKKCGRVKPVNWMPTLPCICNQCLSSLKFYSRLWQHVLIDTISSLKFYSRLWQHVLIDTISSLKFYSRLWQHVLIDTILFYKYFSLWTYVFSITFVVCLFVFNATFNNISVILWRSVILAEETWVPGENHWPVASHCSSGNLI